MYVQYYNENNNLITFSIYKSLNSYWFGV